MMKINPIPMNCALATSKPKTMAKDPQSKYSRMALLFCDMFFGKASCLIGKLPENGNQLACFFLPRIFRCKSLPFFDQGWAIFFQ